MQNALIGHSGYVGSTLLRQTAFEALYRSTNISEIRGRQFDQVVCAGAPAQKWLANKDPEGDRAKIDSLIQILKTVECRRFILISTVDVFADSREVDEDSVVDERGLTAYGLHRRWLEKAVEDHFADSMIVRLPGLVGPGLRKNIVFDFLNDNNVASIESRNVFQFYPMVNLAYDLRVAESKHLKLVHLTSAPVSVAEVSKEGFGRGFVNELDRPLVSYDFRSKHAALFGGAGPYQYSRRESLMAIRAYAQSEPKAVKAEGAK